MNLLFVQMHLQRIYSPMYLAIRLLNIFVLIQYWNRIFEQGEQ